MFSGSQRQERIIATVGVTVEMQSALQRAIADRHWLASVSRFETYLSASRRPSFGPLISRTMPAIVFVDFSQLEAAQETTQYLRDHYADKVVIIAIGDKSDATSVITAMQSGCSNFLEKPVTPKAISSAFDALERQWTVGNSSPAERRATVLTFLGAKGGVGTTTLAVHVAAYLSRHHKKKVLLIDHHRELGHACIYLGIDGTSFLFSEVVRNVNRLDTELLSSFVARHSSGLHVMSSPDTKSDTRPTPIDALPRTIKFLISEYDFIIADCEAERFDLAIPFGEVSSVIYLVGTPEVAAVRDISRTVDMLAPSHALSEKLQIVVNRATSPFSIPIEQIEKAIKLPVTVRIPDCYRELIRSENLGEPIQDTNNSEIAGAFLAWSDSLAGETSVKRPLKKRSILGYWRKAAIAQ